MLKKLFPCFLCKKILKSQKNLKNHEKVHATKQFHCDYCESVFTNKRDISHHIDIHRKYSILQCKVCGVSFTTTKILKDHLKGHLSPRICEFCAKPFVRIVDLKLHIAAKHIMELKYNCSFCPRTFATRKTQKEHEKRIHKTIKKEIYKCLDCEQMFPFREDLRVHSFHHYDGKVFTCKIETCKKVFKSQSLLKVHQKSHSQEKHYHCIRCEKSFVQSSGLSKHFRKCNGVAKETKMIPTDEIVRIAKLQYQELLDVKGRLLINKITTASEDKSAHSSQINADDFNEPLECSDMDRR